MYHQINELAKYYNRTYPAVIKIIKREGIPVLRAKKKATGAIVAVITGKDREILEKKHPELIVLEFNAETDIHIPDAHKNLQMSRDAIWRYIRKLNIPVLKRKAAHQPINCISKEDMEKIRKAAPIILEDNPNSIDYLLDDEE